jgi:hypothetical protein
MKLARHRRPDLSDKFSLWLANRLTVLAYDASFSIRHVSRMRMAMKLRRLAEQIESFENISEDDG